MSRWLLLTACLASCGLDNTLSGSVSELFPLTISKVELAQNGEAMQITYVNNRGVFLDVVARISVSLQVPGMAADGSIPTIALEPGTKLALDGDAPNGAWRCAVSHAPGGEPVRNFPRVKKGDLAITAGGRVGEKTKGDFSILFEQEGGDVGFGRTLYGDFSGEMLDAGFGDIP